MTAAQQRAWKGYQRTRERLGRTPTMNEAARAAGYRGASGLHRALQGLAESKQIRRTPSGGYERVVPIDLKAELTAVAASLLPYPAFDAQRQRLERLIATMGE